MNLFIGQNIEIPLGELEFSFARSGGPGGQNVNKVNSKAMLRWSILASPSLPEEVRGRFLAKYGKRLTADGILILVSQRHRDQSSNCDDCLEKLREMIASVAERPTPRRPTKPTFGSKIRRVEAKRDRSVKKQRRRAPGVDD
jgi:ribosome-associated protein